MALLELPPLAFPGGEGRNALGKGIFHPRIAEVGKELPNHPAPSMSLLS